jgi:hypothetical protein
VRDAEAQCAVPLADRLGDLACDLPLLGVGEEGPCYVVADEGAEACVFGCVVGVVTLLG